MITSTNDVETLVRAKGARFDDDILYITLSDEREISLPMHQMSWVKWLANATSEQRAKWTLEPGGFAIYWEDLDDGIEISYLLSMQALG